MKKGDCKAAARPALIAVVLLALFSPLAEAQSNADPLQSRKNLQAQMRALGELLTDFEFETFEKEQTRWAGETQRICDAASADQKPECYESHMGNRASVLQRQVAGALKDGVATLSLGDWALDVRWRLDKETGTVTTQLRHGDRALTELVGVDKFDIVGRAGNAEAEAIAIRARKNLMTFVIVNHDARPLEIWRYWPSQTWMKQPPVVDAKGELLRLTEQVEKPPVGMYEVASPAILEWTPSAGWTIAQPFRIRSVLPKAQQFDGLTRPGEACKSPLKDTDTVRLGSRTLVIGLKSDEQDYTSEPFGPYALAFGCDLLIGSNVHPPGLSDPRQIDGASVMLSTEASGGSLGFNYRHILADVPGHGVQVWPFPEAGPANDVDAIATSFGYLFLTPASPGMEGRIYRWTPTTGYTFDGYRPFTPHDAPMPNEDSNEVLENLLNNGEVYRAFARAAGPSFIGRAFDVAWRRSRIDRQWAPDLIVFSECDGSRRCDYSGGRTIGIFKPETHNFYFAFQQNQQVFSLVNKEPPQPAVWEFHPPLELWPEDAAKVIETVRQGDVVLK